MRAGITSIIALAGLLAPTYAQAQCPAGPPQRGTLAVVGNGEVHRKPKIATVDVSLVTRGPTLDGTSRDHRQRVARAAPAIEHFKAEGVTVDEGTFTLSEERIPAPAGGRPNDAPPTCRAATRYGLPVRSLDRIDAVVAEIAASGLFEVGSLRFAVADQEAALDDARRAAMADALRQARVYADAGGVSLDGIDHIVDGQAAPRIEGVFDLPVRTARSASVGIVPPRALDFTGSVTVTWHIVPH